MQEIPVTALHLLTPYGSQALPVYLGNSLLPASNQLPPIPIDLIESEKASLSVCVHSPVMLETS